MNSKKSEALNCIQSAINALDEEIKNPEVSRVAEVYTLSEFRKLLGEMHKDVELGTLAAPDVKGGGMGRVIADSWPSSSVLGELVVTAENAFIGFRL